MLKVFVLPLLASLVACGAPKAHMNLGVAGLPDGSPIPARYGEDGGDASPELVWSGVPEGAMAFALTVEDPDAPGGIWIHWVAYDLPVSQGLAGNQARSAELPNGGKQGVNSWGRLGWNGPAPPPGKVHHYHFTVYALSAPTGLPSGATIEALRAAMKGRILAEGRWTGTYRR